MSSSSIEFHKIWIDQCAATEDIRESFGLKDALDLSDRRETLHVPDGVGAGCGVRRRGAGVR